MAKRFISAVYSDGVDLPESFTIVIDDEMRARILELKQALETLKVHKIEEFCYAGTWSTYELPDIGTDAEAIIEHERDSIPAIEAESVAVDMPFLSITQSGVRFYATPKHDEDDSELFTRRIPFESLSDPATLVIY